MVRQTQSRWELARPVLRRLVLSGVVLLGCAGAPAGTQAAEAPQSAALSALDARLTTAIQALQAGKHQEAARLLTAELSRSSGDPFAIAVISYYRGVAQSRAGRTIEAIADFNQALFRKQLPADLAAQARMERGRAYAANGQDDRAQQDLAAVPRVPGPASENASTSEGWQPALAMNAADATVATPAAIDTATSARASQSASLPNPAQPFGPSEQPLGLNADPAAATAAPSSVTVSQPSLGDFFSGLLGGGQRSPPANAAKPTETASIAPSAQGLDAPGVDAQGVDAGWTSSADRAERAAEPVAQAERGLVLRLVAVRELAEARAMVDRLTSRHRNLLGNKKPRISPVTLGNMGAFYEVTIGPFAQNAAPDALCDGFSEIGIDCLPIAR
jgi:tetratricopeptide (TPR) repeat protein